MALAGGTVAFAQFISTAPRVFISGTSYNIALCPGPAPAGQRRCFARIVTDRTGHPLFNRFVPNRFEPRLRTNVVPAGYTPNALNQAYNPSVVATYPTGVGKSSTIVAVVDAYGYTNAERDLGVYRSTFHLPACTTANGCFTKYNQTGVAGNYPTQNLGWAGETALDLDMVSAMCPNCKIILIQANTSGSGDLAASVNTAVAKGAHVVSNSYGSNETGPASDFNADYNHPGVAITASAGDDGWKNYQLGAPYGANFPASSQYVTAVGGTTLSRTVHNTRGFYESAWGGVSGDGATGSGCSLFYPKPVWQKDTLCTKRMSADVSAVADPDTGLAVYGPVTLTTSGWSVVGGTSAAAPIIGGLYGANGGTVTLGSVYSSATLNDVVVGSNGSSPAQCFNTYFCNAYGGYDGPTGLGTPTGETGF
jgi:subtilase family serine protease